MASFVHSKPCPFSPADQSHSTGEQTLLAGFFFRRASVRKLDSVVIHNHHGKRATSRTPTDGSEVAFERCRSPAGHLRELDRNLQPAQRNTAQVPRLSNACRSFSQESSRADAACKLVLDAHKSRFSRNSHPECEDRTRTQASGEVKIAPALSGHRSRCGCPSHRKQDKRYPSGVDRLASFWR